MVDLDQLEILKFHSKLNGKSEFQTDFFLKAFKNFVSSQTPFRMLTIELLMTVFLCSIKDSI